MRGADLLVKTLAAAGVTRIFSLSGNQIMPIYDACLDARIEIVHTRHEAAAVFMADAYAQLTGGIGVCLVTAAPGASNALGPLFTARQSESPVLFITGDSPVGQDGKGAFQELDQVPMTSALTKLSFRAKTAQDLGNDIARAIRTALSGRPGPVHIAVPFDVVEENITNPVVPSPIDLAREARPLPASDAELITQMVAEAKSPIIVTGPALNKTRSGDTHSRLADALDVPVVAMESPRGLKGPALGDIAISLAKADVIVSLGKPVNFSLGFGSLNVCSRNAKWIVIDAEACERERAQLNLGDRLVLTAAADPKDAVSSLIEFATKTNSRAEWRAEVAANISKRSYSPEDPHPSGKITPAALCSAVQRQLNSIGSTVVISDGGEFGQWSQAGTNADYRVINGPSGAIGGALCYGVAAKKAKPDATVFALMGDGTVGFHFAEFETAARENTPFVVVIGNDECWNAEHQIQMREYGPDRLIGCKLSGARYDLAAAALGGHGEFVTDFAELDAALSRAVQSGKVACVNVQIVGVPAPSGTPPHGLRAAWIARPPYKTFQRQSFSAVYCLLRCSVSVRHLEEILAERGITVDHRTLNRWVVKFSLRIAFGAQIRKVLRTNFATEPARNYQMGMLLSNQLSSSVEISMFNAHDIIQKLRNSGNAARVFHTLVPDGPIVARQ